LSNHSSHFEVIVGIQSVVDMIYVPVIGLLIGSLEFPYGHSEVLFLQPGTEASNTGICFPAVSYYW
jgi:hypothetical protein